MKKLLSVILSLTIAVCAFSSCAQKEPVEEISVETVSVPDELKADQNESDSANNSSDEVTDNTDDTNEDSNEPSDEPQSENTDETENQSQPESQPDDVSEPDIPDSESTPDSSQDSGSSDTEQVQTDNPDNSNDNSTSQPDNSQPTVTTTKEQNSNTVTTTTSKSNGSSSGGTTTTKAQTTKTTTTAKVTTTTKVTTKTTTTTQATAVTLPPAQIEYPEGAVIIELSGTPTCDSSDVTIAADKISITAGGIYYLSGSFDGQIYIKTGESNTGEEDIELYLGGVDIECSYGPAIFCDNAKRLEIHVEEGTSNVVRDGGSDAVSNGAIFANDTIEIRGKGTLSVYGNNREGIASDDDIFIENGNIYIYSVDDGMNANDCITINGGYTYIEATGDGLDSKGTTVMNGGSVIIAKTGALESAIESDSTYTLNGGTLIAVGGSGVIKGATTTSTQGIITLNLGSAIAAGTVISVSDGTNTLVAFKPHASFAYSTFTFTSADLTKGSQYSIYANGSITSSAIVDGVYSNPVISAGIALGTATAS